MKASASILFLLIAMAHSGCALGRDHVALAVPAAKTYPAVSKAIIVDLPKDARDFQDSPRSADIPSVDGDLTKTSREELVTLIGRKRNTYGKGLGDVALPTGETVETRTQALLVEAFKRRGYSTSSVTGTTRHCTATIKEYWSWMRPGFWVMAIESRITLHVSVGGQFMGRNFDVTGFGRDESAIGAGPGMYKKAYSLAMEDVLKNIDAKLAENGL